MPIIVLILLSLSGGLAYVSKSALPGDALYTIKTSVDEPIEEALAFGPKAESAVHIDHALERLREVDQLKNSGKLDKRTEVFARFAFENELSKVNADIEKLNARNDYMSAREAERMIREGLKKSTILPTLFGVAATGTPDGQIAEGVFPEGAPQNVTPSSRSTVTPSASGNPTSIQSSSTKYVPKLLPQRANIQRGDDGEEEDD
jgi:hypothetical protein